MGAFQEERQVLIASPFCKFAHGIESVQRIPYYVEMATRNAIYGRPGATYLDVPDDIITGKCDVDKVVQVERAPDPPRMVAPMENIEAALNLLERAGGRSFSSARAWRGRAPRTKSALSSSGRNCRSCVRRWARA
jgi:2-hydroxyacyl-CoA lyase 1